MYRCGFIWMDMRRREPERMLLYVLSGLRCGTHRTEVLSYRQPIMRRGCIWWHYRATTNLPGGVVVHAFQGEGPGSFRAYQQTIVRLEWKERRPLLTRKRDVVGSKHESRF